MHASMSTSVRPQASKKQRSDGREGTEVEKRAWEEDGPTSAEMPDSPSRPQHELGAGSASDAASSSAARPDCRASQQISSPHQQQPNLISSSSPQAAQMSSSPTC